MHFKMENNFRLETFTVVAPQAWKDITETTEQNNMPFTLARDDGYGALQFSTAVYKSGQHPNITALTLDELRHDFANSKGFQDALDEMLLHTPLIVSSGSYHVGDDFVRVWYCSDGQNVALVTYVSEFGKQGDEPKDCDSIVLRLHFDAAKT